MSVQLLLVPGLLCTEAVWSGVVAALAGSGIVPKLLPWHLTAAPTISHVAAAALGFADAEIVAVAGFSYGGYVALEMARQAPHRIAALALVSSQAREDADHVKARRRAQQAAAQAAGTITPVLAHHIPALFHPRHVPANIAEQPALLTPEGVGAVAASHPAFACAVRMAHEVGVRGFVEQQNAIMSRHDSRAVLAAWGATSKPIAVVGGGMDALIPVRAQRDAWRTVWHARHPRPPHGLPGGGGAGLEEGDGEGVAVGGDAACRWRALGPMASSNASTRGGSHVGVGHASPLEASEDVAAVLREMMARL